MTGKAHFNKSLNSYIDTPHVHDSLYPGEVRSPFPCEIPGG